MRITKLEHSGVVVEENGAFLLCDPVEIESQVLKLVNVEGIVFTHGHSDHYQPAVLQKFLQINPDMKIFTPDDMEVDGAKKVVAEMVEDLPHFHLEFFGENHAEIVPGNYICKNVGVIINDRVVNPGDSFETPDSMRNCEVLFVANSAPWLRIVESMNFIKEVMPKVVIPFHEALNSEFGNQVANNWLSKACDETGCELKVMKIGEGYEV